MFSSFLSAAHRFYCRSCDCTSQQWSLEIGGAGGMCTSESEIEEEPACTLTFHQKLAPNCCPGLCHPCILHHILSLFRFTCLITKMCQWMRMWGGFGTCHTSLSLLSKAKVKVFLLYYFMSPFIFDCIKSLKWTTEPLQLLEANVFKVIVET